MKKCLLAFVAIACVFLLNPVQSWALFNSEPQDLSEELSQVESQLLPGAESIVGKSMNSKNKKVQLTGLSRIEFRGIYLEKSKMTNVIRPLNIGVDPSIGEPNLVLQVHATPSYNSYFNVQLGFSAKYDSAGTIAYSVGNEFMSHGLFNTSIGIFQFFAGGPFWTLNNTPLTFGSGIGAGRNPVFLRMPWDQVFPSVTYYPSEFLQFKWMGDAAASRTGSVGLKGFRLDGLNLPGQMDFLVFAGVNDQYYNKMSKLTFGNIKKNLGFAKVSLNWDVHWINHSALLPADELNSVVSTMGTFSLAGYNFMIEPALSSVKIKSDGTDQLGYAVNFNVNRLFRNKYAFRIDSYFVPSDFKSMNSAVVSVSPRYSTDGGILPNYIEEKGGIFGNRTGGKLTAGYLAHNFLAEATIGMSRTLEDTSNKISFPHHLIHFEYFYIYDQRAASYDGSSLNIGHAVDYEGAYEVVGTNAAAPSTKFFNLLEVSVRYNFQALSKYLRLTTVFAKGGFNGIGKSLSYNLVSADTFKNIHYEVFLSQGITRNVFLVGFYAREYFSSENILPVVDQLDVSYGAGLNIDLYAQTALYLKVRRFEHLDYVESNNNDFSGYWANIELKTAF